MVRPPDPESKTCSLVLKAKPGETAKIRAVKEICRRNNISISLVLMKYGVDPFLKRHNWPPGNSQTVLESFGAAAKKECWRCHKKFPTLTRVEYVSGLVKDSCSNCVEKDRKRGVIKKVMRAV